MVLLDEKLKTVADLRPQFEMQSLDVLGPLFWSLRFFSTNAWKEIFQCSQSQQLCVLNYTSQTTERHHI